MISNDIDHATVYLGKLLNSVQHDAPRLGNAVWRSIASTERYKLLYDAQTGSDTDQRIYAIRRVSQMAPDQVTIEILSELLKTSSGNERVQRAVEIALGKLTSQGSQPESGVSDDSSKSYDKIMHLEAENSKLIERLAPRYSARRLSVMSASLSIALIISLYSSSFLGIVIVHPFLAVPILVGSLGFSFLALWRRI